MSAKEFVLVPKETFMKEEPEIGQILKDPLVNEKAIQLSLLQRNRHPPPPPPPLENSQPVSSKEEFSEDEILDELSILPQSKLQRAKLILAKIKNSPNVSIDEKGDLTLHEISTNLPVANFLYDLQQQNKKLDNNVYAELISELNLGTHLIINSKGKKLVEYNKLPPPDDDEEITPQKKSRKNVDSFETPKKSPWKHFTTRNESPRKTIYKGSRLIRKHSKSSETE